MTLLARTKFFGGGHPLSGLDPRHLGVPVLPGSRTRRSGVARPAAATGEGA
jgi:preprotein translocase subunit SecD